MGTIMINLNFGQALEAIKHGRNVARKGWNGKNMYLRYVDLYSDNCFSVVEHEPTDGTLAPWIGMKTADNQFVPWLASQTDLLAEDWTVLS